MKYIIKVVLLMMIPTFITIYFTIKRSNLESGIIKSIVYGWEYSELKAQLLKCIRNQYIVKKGVYLLGILLTTFSIISLLMYYSFINDNVPTLSDISTILVNDELVEINEESLELIGKRERAENLLTKYSKLALMGQTILTALLLSEILSGNSGYIDYKNTTKEIEEETKYIPLKY